MLPTSKRSARRRRALRTLGSRASGPPYEGNDGGADLVDRRSRFGKSEANVRDATIGGGDVFAAEAVDVIERHCGDGRRWALVVDRPLAQQHARVGVVGIHVLDDAMPSSEGAVDNPVSIGVGVDPIHAAEAADPADRGDIDPQQEKSP